MKLFFKVLEIALLLSLSQISHSREKIMITYNQHSQKAALIEKILVEQIDIPSGLITLKWKKEPCEKDIYSILHICVDAQGSMIFIHANNKIIENSFKIFREEVK